MFKGVFLLLLMNFFGKIQAQKPDATLDHISLHVQNLDRSVAFYTDVFQLDSIPDPFPEFRVTWFQIGKGIQLHLFEDKGPIPVGRYHLCFRVLDINQFIDLLKIKKITYFNSKGQVGVLTTRSDKVQQLYFNDPDGHKIEVNDARY